MIDFEIDYHSGVPVYKQMTEALAAAILAGELRQGDKLPPIRKLSQRLGINPNTTAKVYRELELKGYIESRTGSGCFVLPVSEPVLSPVQKEARLEGLFDKLMREAGKLRIGRHEVLRFLQERAGQ